MDHADICIKNVRVFNSYLKKFISADVFILNERILYVDTKKSCSLQTKTVVDGNDQYMIPGLIDIHMHIESSMMTPGPFCQRLAACGVTTIVSEPHEIANVHGLEGIRAMIAAGEDSPIDVYYGIPSSVPSTSSQLETTGATIGMEEMVTLLKEDKVICVGEIMNYRQIIKDNNLPITEFLTYLRQHKPHFVIEGHCPSLVDLDLAKFLYLGINADHTEHSLEEIKQRFENGMFVELQEKTLKPEIFDYIQQNNLYEHFGFVTDDCMADVLQEKGHLNVIVQQAIALGMRPEDAIYNATYTNARRMNLTDRGAIAPGKLADFCLVDDLNSLHMTAVYKNGQAIWQENTPIISPEATYHFPKEFYQSVQLRPLNQNNFTIEVPEACNEVTVKIMEINNGSTKTTAKTATLPVQNHVLQWESSPYLLAAVFERHGKNQNIGYGFVTGDCIKKGAVATTYFHDHHNLCVIGKNIESMMLAANRVIALQGGIVTVEAGKIQAELALPVCGILSDCSVDEIGTALKSVRNHLINLGYRHYNPIMSLCTLGLPVSPELKLTDQGLINVKTGTIERLYTI